MDKKNSSIKKKPKAGRYDDVLMRLNDNLILAESNGDGIAVQNIKRLIAFFEKKAKK